MSDIIMHVDTDAPYLVLPKSHSRIAGHFHPIISPPNSGMPNPKLNSPILTIYQTLKNVVTSSSEAETGGMFLNGQVMVLKVVLWLYQS